MPLPADKVSGQTDVILSMALYTTAAVLLVGFLLLAAWWLGSKRRTVVKQIPYESGVFPTGTARLAYPVPFYLVAIFFIVFDVEAVFIFTWGVAWDELGFAGLIHITIFIVILLLGLFWLWLKGGLEWGPTKAVRGSKFDVQG
ncbi:NADH-quinone oxidoreductase subunit A [Geotalea sp. SG265]|uniref:NADH-quinone oxidoreductase subunit A n=1 Tax=Geotalea sp. SG265 TaxID=2922867 RepID=UPI001FB0338B|nr:NADH-quinone oxidoreductase subunit A [Geotalea sp. SG265]